MKKSTAIIEPARGSAHPWRGNAKILMGQCNLVARSDNIVDKFATEFLHGLYDNLKSRVQ